MLLHTISAHYLGFIVDYSLLNTDQAIVTQTEVIIWEGKFKRDV